MRLYLPQRWVDDPARCDRAEIPTQARRMRSKTDLALELVRAARARGMRFGWVGGDGGYGKEPAFLRALDDMGEIFVADVHCDQRVWSEPPGLHGPAPKVKGQGRPPGTNEAAAGGAIVEGLTTPASGRPIGGAAPCARAHAARDGSIARIGGSGECPAGKRRQGAGVCAAAPSWG